MVRAGDCVFAISGFLDQLEVAVPADIVKYPDLLVGTSNQQQGVSSHFNRPDIPYVDEVIGKAHESPGPLKQLVGLK